MKKHMTRNMILMLVLDVILGIVLALYIANTGTVPAADNADTYTDGTYTASAQGYLSEVGVTRDHHRRQGDECVIDASGETPELGGQGGRDAVGSLLAAGSTVGVDAVSGSTMTSDAVFAAMNDCLAQAAQ